MICFISFEIDLILASQKKTTGFLEHGRKKQVQQVVRSELRGRTLICIAHRLETVRDYDRLAVIGDGQLLEASFTGCRARRKIW